ncbi:MAG TPA: hypothetical protein VI789_07105 [Dehalococcoidia bacterium]|nr:hypothetical protein [Dehalococcoidia bacterium]
MRAGGPQGLDDAGQLFGHLSPGGPDLRRPQGDGSRTERGRNPIY